MNRSTQMIGRIADRVDLAIDLLTLGQYGLERVPEDEGCERRRTRARAARRRDACATTVAISWDWPAAREATVRR